MEQNNSSPTSQLLASCHDLIAYFSMEIGLSHQIPTYSGGLGVLAGDTLKGIADLGVDTVAVTLLSEKGYFDQTFTDDHFQQEHDVVWEKERFMQRVPHVVEVVIEDRAVNVTAWKHILTGAGGHQVTVYFLDTNLEENAPEDRGLTSHLYGGDNTYRLRQEMVLGIAGVRLLRKLNHFPKKYHLNEGHAAFLIYELYNELHEVHDEAEKRRALQKLCSFTTHTPVAAGHDAFPVEDIYHFFKGKMPQELLASSVRDGKFSMTRLAMHFSSYINAVARKHQEVSKKMFPEYPIHYITNGVHVGTWASKPIAQLFDKHIIDWRTHNLELRNAIKIPDEELIAAHRESKELLFSYVKEKTGVDLDPEVLTLGFARRATAYKRADLLLRDIPRLKHLSNTVGKIQIIYAGKAHPRDHQGKEIIQRIRNLARELAPDISLVFLENYDMYVASLLIPGVDVWLNTPKRPLEASGTSGMKAAVNGVPSLSIPDGWWVEGGIHNITGWNIGYEFSSADDEDAADADSLYWVLEHDVLPTFYHNKKEFIQIMKRAISLNGSYFNTHRMAKQYLVQAYTRNN